MNTYRIYHFKDHTKELLAYYPNLKNLLFSIKPINNFYYKQIEALFYLNDDINDYFKNYFKDREGYENKLNIHTLYNQLTKESISAHVYDYYIEIEANNKKNIFYEILYQKSENYAIID